AVSLHFLDLAQCEGFATGLLTGGSKGFAGGAGSDGGRDERACFCGRAADLLHGRNPRSGVRRLDVERRARASGDGRVSGGVVAFYREKNLLRSRIHAASAPLRGVAGDRASPAVLVQGMRRRLW